MKVRLGRRVFDAGESPIIAAAGTAPDLGATPGALVSTCERAVAAGAEGVEVDGAETAPIAELVATIRARFPRVVVGVRVSGPLAAEAAAGAGADLLSASGGAVYPWLAEIAAAGETSVAAASSELAERAVVTGVPRDRVLVEVVADPSEPLEAATRRLPDLVHTGWPVLVKLPDGRPLAETLTVAAICAWLGARVFRSDQVPQTRQALDMVASLRGAREPSVGRRGLV